MTPTILALTAILFAADPTPDTDVKPMRKPHPLAPSLNQLTTEEEQKVDDIINRFIKADIGETKGEEAQEAQRDFDALGADAIPGLIRGINRAAKLDHSCPTLMIAKKLTRLLSASDDVKLLEFARDEIGSGVPRGKHAGTLSDLRTKILIRKNAVVRANPQPPPATVSAAKTPRTMTNAELVTASKEGGMQLKMLLAELEQRKGADVLPGLSTVLGVFTKNKDTETAQTVRETMDKYMAKQTAEFVKEKMKDADVEVRRAAIRAAKSSTYAPDLIEALGDDNADVREDAHQGLLKWRKGDDFGPMADADKQQIKDAQAKWRAWLEKTRGH